MSTKATEVYVLEAYFEWGESYSLVYKSQNEAMLAGARIAGRYLEWEDGYFGSFILAAGELSPNIKNIRISKQIIGSDEALDFIVRLGGRNDAALYRHWHLQ